jgi:hypothetical protein
LAYDQWAASLGIDYQLGTQSRIGFNITHLERDADTDDDDFKENHASINLTSAL